jgi:excisionase family DNA binding protein
MRATNQSTVTVAQAATVLAVHPQTVRRLIAAGRLPGHRLSAGPHGHWRIRVSAIEEFLADDYIPAEEAHR